MGDHIRTEAGRALIRKPIFVIGCNRSGTTLLFNTLSLHPETWSLYIEGQEIFYRHYPVDPVKGDQVTDSPSATVSEDIVRLFYNEAHNKEFFKDTPFLKHIPPKLLQRPIGNLYKKAPIRLVEKTPANCLRIPFLVKLFPDAKFIYLVRRGEDVVSSLMEGWKNWSKTGNKPWTYTKWHYLVPPGWQDWTGKSLQEICAFQWVESNRIAWNDLNRYCEGNFLLLRHEDVLANPAESFEKILKYCELPSSRFFNLQVANTKDRIVTTGGSKPRKEKWRDMHSREVESVREIIQPLINQFYP